MPPCVWKSFQGEPYEDIYRLQKALMEQRIRSEIVDTLLLGEHPHVITMGRGTRMQNLLQTVGIQVVEIERGGDVTYHGPGQLVGYPILQLHGDECDLHRYLRRLEEVLIRVLGTYGLEGTRKPGWTGVWVGDRKIASIGVAVRKWVTYHGFALNIATDLSYFNRINPCGLPATVMTSLEALLPDYSYPQELALPVVRERVLTAFEEVFQRQCVPISQEEAAIAC